MQVRVMEQAEYNMEDTSLLQSRWEILKENVGDITWRLRNTGDDRIVSIRRDNPPDNARVEREFYETSPDGDAMTVKQAYFEKLSANQQITFKLVLRSGREIRYLEVFLLSAPLTHTVVTRPEQWAQGEDFVTYRPR